jgi:hypothetical protein
LMLAKYASDLERVCQCQFCGCEGKGRERG